MVDSKNINNREISSKTRQQDFRQIYKIFENKMYKCQDKFNNFKANYKQHRI